MSGLGGLFRRGLAAHGGWRRRLAWGRSSTVIPTARLSATWSRFRLDPTGGASHRKAYLRPSNIDPARHAWAILALVVKRFRQAWPEVRIIFRGDSGFCRWRLLAWCERSDVGYIVGLAKNARLDALARPGMDEAKLRFQASGLNPDSARASGAIR